MTTTPSPAGAAGSAERPTVGGYTLLTKLGEGGMGVVHLARRGDGERIALKVLRPHIVGDDEARQRLEREVGSLQRVHSRWVAGIVDADPWAPVPYVATRYVPGPSLHDLVVDEGAITGPDLYWLAGCLAEGLASVHAAGVLHRDVKPSNVLMEGRTPILIDFGLARVADDPKLTHTGWLLGTPGYLAPEILYGEDATAASDVHSWAATVAYAGTGHPPFGRGPSMAIMDRVRRGQFDLAGLPDDLGGVVAAALDPEPRNRPTLADLLAWLRPLTTRRDAPSVAPPAAVEHDPYTVPLALASQAAADDETDVWPGHESAEPYTLALPPEGATELVDDQWGRARPGPAERLRRGTLLAGLALAAGAGCAAYPWLTAGLLLLLTWLLRSVSLAASAHDQRRQYRGRKWYDGVQLLVAAPWHLVQSIPGALLLGLWALGLAAAAALVCYAVATGVELALFVCGVVLAGSLWWGPGGSRLRGPVSAVVNPVAARPRRWVVALVVVVAAVAVLGFRAELSGASWSPAGGRPHVEIPGR
ncbi:serine/threonine-protein kinase [Nocardioides sp. YIM 152315]|uniref:serine/threonine-protein kinase n=1 Tax=Nocardioides sp. YIM 152315 TaxID=3031760 RepID=UPI0023DB6499|nr:serine/threonine-protein kinase [Nocardioides sp. YIM 152315]MDF1602899.1 serine/threonine-protein kinase [Nocardioides sp. YIM 152315]